jgi:1,4-alpha-glucan branching enzyme
MDGSFVLILHTHLPYVLHHGKWPHGSDWLSEAAAECYIPILNECFALVDEGILPKITLSLSPVVVEQLIDPEFPEIFNFYLDEKITAAEDDLVYFADRPQDQVYMPLAEYWRDWYTDRKRDFNERYGCDLAGAMRELAELDAIALQTCGATHGYFPLLGRDESINAQVEVAVASHLANFGNLPRGIWMPECAYRPCYDWTAPVANPYSPAGTRKGVEQILAEHGLEYTVVDSHLTRGGKPLGVYGSRFTAVRRMVEQGKVYPPLDDSRSVHDVYQICSTGDIDAGTVSIFTRDGNTALHVWSAEMGYPGSPSYLEFHKKHHNSGHRYWRVTGTNVDLGGKQPYQPDQVAEQVRRDAAHFAGLVEQEMRQFRMSTGREGTLSVPFDTELFGHWWFEGPRFLGEVIRCLNRSRSVRARTAPEELDAKDPGLVIQIPEGSWGEGGDHRVWFNDKTRWTWPMIYEIEELFLALVRAHDAENPMVVRILTQMARENLLLQASDWQFLISTESAADYATERFNQHYENAKLLAGYIGLLHGRESLSGEEIGELERLEMTNRLFPNLRLDRWRDNKNVVGAQRAPQYIDHDS